MVFSKPGLELQNLKQPKGCNICTSVLEVVSGNEYQVQYVTHLCS